MVDRLAENQDNMGKLLSVRFIQTAATGSGRTPERRQRQWSAMQVMKVGKIISCG